MTTDSPNSINSTNPTNPVVCVVGLGYVGLPLEEIIRLDAPDVVKFIRGKAKAYQVKQVRNLILKYRLHQEVKDV